MIRRCEDKDFDLIYQIINDAAGRYKGVIPKDRWKQPYMSKDELRREIDKGIVFWGYKKASQLVGVMGIQPVKDVTLIRHAYVCTAYQNKGIGTKLLAYLQEQTNRPILMGTWKQASWAISFYQKHGFRLVSPKEKDRLLKKYWSIPQRQIETSVVLADQKWFDRG